VSQEPRITVVIPTYHRPDRLGPLFDALAAQTLARSLFDVVVVDNASGDQTWDVLQKLAAEAPFGVQVLRLEVNRGPAAARNLGWRTTATPSVAFLDDDCLPEPEWLANGMQTLTNGDGLGLVQGRVRLPATFDPSVMGTWYHSLVIAEPTPYFESCNIFYDRRALESAGGFNEEIGWWGEDSDLGWRVIEAGWGRAFASDAVVTHAVQERGWQWYARTGLLERNTMKLAKDHPGFRREAFWQPWAYRRDDVLFLLAVLALVRAVRSRRTLLLTLPYFWLRRPRQGLQGTLRFVAQSMAVDAARSTGQIRGALAHRLLAI
jgi:GT2 family glycosyltransferase